jgi:ribosomal protein L24
MQIKIGDVVQIIGGTYQNRTGIVVKLTAKMAVLKSTNGSVEVRVMKSNVKRKHETEEPGQIVQGERDLAETNEAVHQSIMQELQEMRHRMDELINVLASLNATKEE